MAHYPFVAGRVIHPSESVSELVQHDREKIDADFGRLIRRLTVFKFLMGRWSWIDEPSPASRIAIQQDSIGESDAKKVVRKIDEKDTS